MTSAFALKRVDHGEIFIFGQGINISWRSENRFIKYRKSFANTSTHEWPKELASAVTAVSTAHENINCMLKSSDIIDIPFSFILLWKTRGDASCYVLRAVVDVMTWLVIDYHVSFTHCLKCLMFIKNYLKSGRKNAMAKQRSKSQCKTNITRSPGAIDVTDANSWGLVVSKKIQLRIRYYAHWWWCKQINILFKRNPFP